VSFELRLATPQDARQIADLQIAAWHAAFVPLMPSGFEVPPREQFLIMGERTLDEPGVERTVAAAGGRLVGLLTHGMNRDADSAPGVGEVRALFVHPDHWRTGVGTALMANALERLRQAGYGEATLWSFRDNTRANVFYEHHGFRADGAAQARETLGQTVEIRYRRSL
jgi:GNAT superfamily N-acetyltransferase